MLLSGQLEGLLENNSKYLLPFHSLQGLSMLSFIAVPAPKSERLN